MVDIVIWDMIALECEDDHVLAAFHYSYQSGTHLECFLRIQTGPHCIHAICFNLKINEA